MSDDEKRSENGGEGAALSDDDEPRPTKQLPTRSLTDIGNDDDDEEEEEEEGENGNDDGEEQDGEEEDEDEDEEDEDEEEEDRPKKRKRRKRTGGNQFLDIEAVADDEEEEEEEGEEGFVAQDDFIVSRDRRDAGREQDVMNFDDADYGDLDGDASHRRLDQRRLAQKDREAEELAESFRTRYAHRSYDAEAMEDWAPKALLMPSVNDPSIWGIKCKIGRERELVLSLSRKAAALAASDTATPLRIISAFHRDSIKGYIYVEARAEDHVRAAVAGLIGVYSHNAGGVFLVDIEEMPDLLRTKQKKVDIQPGGWVRIKRGKYAGDLAQIMDMSENGEEVTVKFIPRIDLTPKDDGVFTGPDGRKRKKGQATPLAFRPPPRFFNPEEIGKIYGKKEITKRPGGILVFKNDTYNEGYCEKDIKLSGLTIEDVSPTIDELQRFLGDGKEGEGSGASSVDFSTIAEAARQKAKSTLQPGDHVEVFEGDQKGLYGTVLSINKDVITIEPHEELELAGTKVEVQSRSIRKRFRTGDHVKVMSGSNADETGLVVQVKDDTVTFLSDLSMQEVTVFSKDVREAAEVGSGVNVIGQYELHDLVQLDTQTTGVIFKIERDMFRIIDQTGTVRMLKPSQIGIKINSRDVVATDQEGYDIKAGDEMKEVGSGNSREGRKGRVLHVYRSIFAFLHNRDYVENGGVFVTYARSLTSTAPKGANRPKSQQLNPELFGKQPVPQAAAGVTQRRDGRIHRKVSVTRGPQKGYAGVIKDVTGQMARVELYTNSKVITISLESLKEQKPDGSLVPLMERPGGGPGYGARGGGGGGGGFAAPGGGYSTGSNGSALGGQNGRTPFPAYGGKTPAWNGGRTPAPRYDGGRTPAPNSGAGGAWDANSGRTPMVQSGASSAWNAGSRTPGPAAGAGNDTWNPSSRTPFHAGGASSSDPWSASSRTPHHPGAFNDGGRTPDPRAGGRTPAYGGRSTYAAPTPAPQEPATPAWDNDWGGAPTPAATAPTPGPSRAYPQTPGAPTPAAAPTPGAYGSAPTPAPYFAAPTPGPAPTPGVYGSAPTPAGVTPGGYYTAATPAMTPYGGYGGRVPGRQAVGAPADWTLPHLKVTFTTTFKHVAQGEAGVVVTSEGGLSTVALDSTGEQVQNVPASSLAAVKPTLAGDTVLVMSGEHRGQTFQTVSRDGSDWMLSTGSGHAVLDVSVLGVKA
ncbi:transcription elongation factor Spt5 [Meredithblackwellia eburnea MCA 4105]